MQIDDQIIGFLKASNYRMTIIKYLARSNFATPSEVAKELNVNLTQISRTLSELENFELVVCTTPNRSKGRIYRITAKGSKVISIMEEQ